MVRFEDEEIKEGRYGSKCNPRNNTYPGAA
jgi:hypothetical protein